MSSLPVTQAFEARLATWPNIASCPFVDLNIVSELPTPPYTEIEYPVTRERIVTAGVRAVVRESGGARFILTVKTFQPDWKPQVLGWVEELRDRFRKQQFDGVETFEASPPVFDRSNQDGNKFKVPFVVLYKFDAIKG